MKKILVSIFLIITLISCKKEISQQTEENTVPNNTSTGVITQTPLIVPPKAPPASTGSNNVSDALTGAIQGEILETSKYLSQQKTAIELAPVDPLENAPKPGIVQKDSKVLMKLGKHEFQTLKNKIVTLDNIVNGTKLSSKLHLSGKVPTNWVFEGTFPIKVYDIGNGLLGEGVGKANIFDKTGKVIESSVVDFEADLDLMIPALTKKGFLKLFADNPSGMIENADSVDIKVVF